MVIGLIISAVFVIPFLYDFITGIIRLARKRGKPRLRIFNGVEEDSDQ